MTRHNRTGAYGRLAVVGISHLAQATGVTVRALRHYEDLGLLKPVRTSSGERRFPPDQCERASLIALLRRCDVPLNAVSDIIDTAAGVERDAKVRRALNARARDLAAQIGAVQAALADAGLTADGPSRRAA